MAHRFVVYLAQRVWIPTAVEVFGAMSQHYLDTTPK